MFSSRASDAMRRGLISFINSDIPNQYYVPQQQHAQQQQHQQYQLPQTQCSAAHAQTTCASFSAPAPVGQAIDSRYDCIQGGGEIRDC